MATYVGLPLPFLRLVWFRSSSGLSTAAIAAYTGLASTVGMLVLLGISGGGMNPAR